MSLDAFESAQISQSRLHAVNPNLYLCHVSNPTTIPYELIRDLQWGCYRIWEVPDIHAPLTVRDCKAVEQIFSVIRARHPEPFHSCACHADVEDRKMLGVQCQENTQ